MTTPPAAPAPRARRHGAHCLFAVAAAVIALAAYHAAFFEDFQSSDGANYATVARNLLEGRGLTSSVIQPGLMKLVRTDRRGQAYVTQMPLWPVLLAAWFHVFGATPTAAVTLSYLCCLAATAACWWMGSWLSGRMLGGYLAVALLLTNPHYVSNVIAVYNVALHSALIAGVFVFLWLPPTFGRAILVGVLVGLAVVTREPSIFVLAGIGYCWWDVSKERDPRRLEAMSTATRHLLVVIAIVAVALMLEKEFVARAAGTRATPTLRATFFYYTPVLDANWYFIYDDPALGLSPLSYFSHHPLTLAKKVGYQLWVCLLQQTLPVMQSTTTWFLPVMAPWLLVDRRARRFSYALLLVLGVLVVVGTVTTLHLQYFLAYFPEINAVVAATVLALMGRLREGSLVRPRDRWLARVAITYALVPVLFNLAPYLAGRRMATGEYGLTPRQVATLTQFIEKNTPLDAVVVSSHSPLLAWHTRRTIVQYSGSPAYRISNSAMWHRIDAQVPIDFILLNSWAAERPEMAVLDGFSMVKAIKTPEVKAWLFRRRER